MSACDSPDIVLGALLEHNISQIRMCTYCILSF